MILVSSGIERNIELIIVIADASYGIDFILVSSSIEWIIELIIMIADASCFDMIFLALFICTQVLCRLQDFDWGLEGGSSSSTGKMSWWLRSSVEVMGFPIFELFFPFRA